jgi:hypothetical protein
LRIDCNPSTVQAQALDAQQILAKAKQAAGGNAWDKVRSLYSKGKTKISGVEADREEWVDLQRLRFAEKFQYGPEKYQAPAEAPRSNKKE